MSAVRVRRKMKPPTVSTVTVADIHALADRLARAGTTRSPPDRTDLRLAAEVIRTLLASFGKSPGLPGHTEFRLYDDGD